MQQPQTKLEAFGMLMQRIGALMVAAFCVIVLLVIAWTILH